MKKSKNEVNNLFKNCINNHQIIKELHKERCPNYLEAILELYYEFEIEIRYSFYLIMVRLGGEFTKKYHQSLGIEKILNSFNKLVHAKCSYSLNSDKVFCFTNHGGEEFYNSSEFNLYASLGILACLRINLEYLELKNPRLDGLVLLLSCLYPEAVDAYLKISKQFGFDGTTSLEYDISDEKEFKSFLVSMEIERWNQEKVQSIKNQKNVLKSNDLNTPDNVKKREKDKCQKDEKYLQRTNRKKVS